MRPITRELVVGWTVLLCGLTLIFIGSPWVGTFLVLVGIFVLGL